MNAKQRKTLQGYVESLDEIKNAVDEMAEEEQDKYDNMPEGLQESERGEAIQEAIGNLESASSSLEEAIDYLNEIIGGWPMDEITIKVTKDQAERIEDALKYRAAHVNEYYKDLFLEILHIVKSQIESQW